MAFLCSVLFTAFAAAQTAEADHRPDAPSTVAAQKSKPAGSFGMLTTIQRKSLIFPDIATTEGPLSPTQKFQLFVDQSISLSAVLRSSFSAGIRQATNSPEGYGQGAEGYGKRFGASMARRASQEFFGTFVLASALHQDPRFFPQAKPTLPGSAAYAIERVFVTRADDGHNVPNWSGLFGALMAEGLANSYWPEEERDARHTFKRFGFVLAGKAGSNFLRNYWPVLFKRLRRAPNSTASHN